MVIEMPKTYIITTVVDFLQIPADRREIALREFQQWLSFSEAFSQLGLDGVITMPTEYVWVDDDLGECRVALIDRESGEHLSEQVWPIHQEKRP